MLLPMMELPPWLISSSLQAASTPADGSSDSDLLLFLLSGVLVCNVEAVPDKYGEVDGANVGTVSIPVQDKL